MFGRTPKVMNTKLDPVIDTILSEMEAFGPDSPEYSMMLSHLEKVVNLRKSEDNKKVTPDTMALVAGNLLGILIIVAYEQKHVMASKAQGFILKSK